MKKLIFISVIILSCSIISAQTERGKILLSGGSNLGAYFSGNKSETGTSTIKSASSGFNLDLKMGYFVARNLVIGEYGYVGYDHYKNKDNDYESKGTDVSIGPFIRYYFGQSKVKPFINTQIEWMWANNKYITNNNTSESKYTGPAYGVSGGVAIFVNEHVGLTCALGYHGRSSVNVDDTEDTSFSNTVSFNIGITVSL
jgi:hypothetical protein